MKKSLTDWTTVSGRFENEGLTEDQKTEIESTFIATFLQCIGLKLVPSFSKKEAIEEFSVSVPTHFIVPAKLVLYAIFDTLGKANVLKGFDIE